MGPMLPRRHTASRCRGRVARRALGLSGVASVPAACMQSRTMRQSSLSHQKRSSACSCAISPVRLTTLLTTHAVAKRQTVRDQGPLPRLAEDRCSNLLTSMSAVLATVRPNPTKQRRFRREQAASWSDSGEHRAKQHLLFPPPLARLCVCVFAASAEVQCCWWMPLSLFL